MTTTASSGPGQCAPLLLRTVTITRTAQSWPRSGCMGPLPGPGLVVLPPRTACASRNRLARATVAKCSRTSSANMDPRRATACAIPVSAYTESIVWAYVSAVQQAPPVFRRPPGILPASGQLARRAARHPRRSRLEQGPLSAVDMASVDRFLAENEMKAVVRSARSRGTSSPLAGLPQHRSFRAVWVRQHRERRLPGSDAPGYPRPTIRMPMLNVKCPGQKESRPSTASAGRR